MGLNNSSDSEGSKVFDFAGITVKNVGALEASGLVGVMDQAEIAEEIVNSAARTELHRFTVNSSKDSFEIGDLYQFAYAFALTNDSGADHNVDLFVDLVETDSLGNSTTYVVHRGTILVTDGSISRPGNISLDISRPGNLQLQSRVEMCYAGLNGATVNALTAVYPVFTTAAVDYMGNTLVDGPNPQNELAIVLSAQLAAADADFAALLNRGSVRISRPGNAT